MSKLLKAQEEMNQRGKNLFSDAAAQAAADSTSAPHGPEKETKSGPSIVPAAAAVQKRQAMEQKSGFKLALLVTCLVAFFGLTLLILNLKLMDELRISRQSSLQLATNLQSLEGRLSKLEGFTGEFKKQTQQETENFRDRLMEIKDSMAGYDANLTDIAAQLSALKEGLKGIQTSLDANNTQLTEIKTTSANLQEKLKSLDSLNHSLKDQYDELRGMMRLSTTPAESK